MRWNEGPLGAETVRVYMCNGIDRDKRETVRKGGKHGRGPLPQPRAAMAFSDSRHPLSIRSPSIGLCRTCQQLPNFGYGYKYPSVVSEGILVHPYKKIFQACERMKISSLFGILRSLDSCHN